ncbi:MAG: hypothetical protein K0Q97_592 [Bacillota bacterium]|jgi:polar amino acid transport system substrate-binding protein|nr:hypothetical protein [Bacillota bacterium]
MYNKKMIKFILFIVIIVLIAGFNQYFNNKFDLNLFEYLNYSEVISNEEMQYLQERGTLYFVTDKNNPPFAFKDETSDQYKGLVLDYITALSIELETEIEFIPMIWEDALNSVISGKGDMTELFYSEKREEHLLFTDEIYTLRAVVMTMKENKDIKYLKDLSGQKVAVQSGDYANEFIVNYLPKIEIINTDDIQQSIMALQEGKVDAIIGEEPVVMNFIGELKIQDEINILSQPLYERDIRIGIKKTDKDLLTILNKGILSLKKKEFVQKIQQKWFGISAPIHKESVSVVTLISLTVVTSILIIIGLWNYFLNTEVKKQTVELNKSRNDLQMTIDAMTDYLVVVDEKGIVINVNKAYITWLNKTREDVIGKYYKELFILDSVNMNLNIKEKSRKEIIYKGMYYNFYTRPLEYEDNWMLIVIEDITDQKISQQQMLQQNKMIAVGQLAAGIAHEIRNPLGLIRNYCYILKGKINLEDVLIGKSINIIESSVLRAGKMVDNLLNFSRIGDDEFNIINLKETITDIISLESKLISKNNIEIIINCDENIMFNTKVESLNHIFLNLLSNAIDAVKDYGIINIDCAVDNNYLYIDFKDNGNGIEEENLEHVFNPFFTTKKVGKGVGLGLYIVYSEVHKLNGEIHVESQAGNKTVFKLKFPLMEDIING